MKLTFSKAEKSLSRAEDTKFCLDSDNPKGWGTFGSYRMAGQETAQTWGPMAMERTCKTADKSYIMGGINLTSSHSDCPLRVRVLHSTGIMMSAVQLLYNHKLTVLAHLVGIEQMGYEADLGLKFEVS